MIIVPTSKWIDLTHQVFTKHRSKVKRYHPILIDNVEIILKDIYQARYKFASPNSRFSYVISFDDEKLETVFRLRFSDYL